MSIETPVYPIQIIFSETNEVITCANELELATALEWFDSEDTQENAVVTDNLGRSIELKIVGLQIIRSRLK